jgi:hypothetical protein
MLYLTQTIISTNSEIYIPTFATIVGSRMSSFERGKTVVELPALVYTVLPVDQQNINDNRDETALNRVLNRTSRWNPLGFTNDITKVRVFLIPSFAQTGGHICTYGVPTTNRHIVTQFSDVKFKGEDYSFYVETLSDNSELPPLPSTQTNRQNRQQLGPAVRAGESIRIIN